MVGASRLLLFATHSLLIMVLYPLSSASTASSRKSTIPAWEAIERRQKQEATEWWLVAQPDHAALSGDLAAQIAFPDFPRLDPEVVQAIALHDEGWAAFDGCSGQSSPRVNDRGRPLSFLEMTPPDFLRAWTGSIERAERVGAIGGVIVSEHFCRIAKARLESRADTSEAIRPIREFLDCEAERQKRLCPELRRSAEEIGALVDVLQFFDLLSLYLCCGSQSAIEFPQKFNGQTIRLHREGECFRTEPALFGGGLSLAVSAQRYPTAQTASMVSIPILLA